MKPSEWLESLRDIDFNDLDTSNIGSWPAAVKAIAGALLMVLVLALGYNFFISDLENQLEAKREEEATLKEQFASKARLSANLELYTQQMKAMENTFGVLLRQLPSDTEVPGLLEDITRTGWAAAWSSKRSNCCRRSPSSFTSSCRSRSPSPVPITTLRPSSVAWPGCHALSPCTISNSLLPIKRAGRSCA